jgi:hypothetical protein
VGGLGAQEKAFYHPPLKIIPVVSGSFGELRSNHFHSGLDLSTQGKTGYRVYCSEDGYVSRIKVSPYGYGKAIYVDHPDGHTTVYAHLERYSQRIDSLVLSRQYARQSFAIELFFESHELPVQRGEVIAYSGNSGGSGGPHLHYEVRRSSSQKPIEPLDFMDEIPDDVCPQIQGLKIYPLSAEAKVEGENTAKYWPAVYYDNRFHPKGKSSIQVSGEVGVGLQVLDYFSDSWRKCGIRSIELFVNDQLYYHSELSAFSFAETRYINSHIDYGEKIRTGKVIQKSFVEPNNPLSVYKYVKGTGHIQVAAGETCSVKYVTKDYAGNASVLVFELHGAAYPNDIPAAGFEPTSSPLIQWNRDFEFEKEGVKVRIDKGSLYKNESFYFEVDATNEKWMTPVYVIGNSEVPVHASISVSLPFPEQLPVPPEKLFVAGVTAKGHPYYIGGTLEENQITARYRGFGKFTIQADTLAPVVKLSKAPAGNNYKGRQQIDVYMQDDLSGIRSYNCYLNDQWVLFEYDAKRNRLHGFKSQFPKLEGAHQTLRIVVEDNRGNLTVREFEIVI